MIKQRIQTYLRNKELREQGKYIGVPIFEYFPKLGEYFPNIEKHVDQILIFAGTNVGKTQFWKRVFLWNVIRFYKSMPNCGYKPHFIIFLHEEDIETFIDSLFSMILYEKYRIFQSPKSLRSSTKHSINNDIVDKILLCEKEVEDVLSYCDIKSSTHNPFGIYKYCREVSRRRGIHYYKNMHSKEDIITIDKYESLDNKEGYAYSHYVPDDKEEMVFVISDHISNLVAENKMTKHESISNFSFNYCRQNMSIHWGYVPILIAQEAFASESQQYTNKGDSIMQKVLPALDFLATNKEVSRDSSIVLSLFNPNRYNFADYEGYNIARTTDGLYNKFRSLFLLKNRHGEVNVQVPLLFDGRCCYFKELPKVIEMTPDIYKRIKNEDYGKY